jgi:hypothetical protein
MFISGGVMIAKVRKRPVNKIRGVARACVFSVLLVAAPFGCSKGLVQQEPVKTPVKAKAQKNPRKAASISSRRKFLDNIYSLEKELGSIESSLVVLEAGKAIHDLNVVLSKLTQLKNKYDFSGLDPFVNEANAVILQIRGMLSGSRGTVQPINLNRLKEQIDAGQRAILNIQRQFENVRQTMIGKIAAKIAGLKKKVRWMKSTVFRRIIHKKKRKRTQAKIRALKAQVEELQNQKNFFKGKTVSKKTEALGKEIETIKKTVDKLRAHLRELKRKEFEIEVKEQYDYLKSIHEHQLRMGEKPAISDEKDLRKAAVFEVIHGRKMKDIPDKSLRQLKKQMKGN